MNAGEICTRIVVIATRGTTLLEASRLMREHNVGTLVIVDARKHPVGIVTDRDLVTKVLAQTPEALGWLTVDDVLTSDVVLANDTDDVFSVLETMHRRHVRRVPVVDDEGALVGILALDDLLDLFAEELDRMARVVRTDAGARAP